METSVALLEITERLTRVEAKLDQALSLKNVIDEHIEKDDRLFFGTDAETDPGLIRQVDRVTQTHKRVSWTLAGVVSIVGANIVQLFWEWFVKHK